MSVWTNLTKRFVAPPMAKPPTEYTQSYMDNFVNILRLYFNQIDNLLGQIVTAQTPLTVTNLPTPSPELTGSRSFVTDSTTATFAAVVSGGGANRVPVYCDGTNWRVG